MSSPAHSDPVLTAVTSCLGTCAEPERVALLTGGGAVLALPVSHSVCRRTLLHTLVLVQEERLFAAEAVGGVLPTRRAARCAATTHLACRITPVRSRTDTTNTTCDRTNALCI